MLNSERQISWQYLSLPNPQDASIGIPEGLLALSRKFTETHSETAKNHIE
jgi:hypothetical protein|tara:strand:+ start:349 stop:498 length:150 start_codon:yes stop_codon:yes gene_type:complete